jgi:hypothetical protein
VAGGAQLLSKAIVHLRVPVVAAHVGEVPGEHGEVGVRRCSIDEAHRFAGVRPQPILVPSGPCDPDDWNAQATPSREAKQGGVKLLAGQVASRAEDHESVRDFMHVGLRGGERLHPIVAGQTRAPVVTERWAPT